MTKRKVGIRLYAGDETRTYQSVSFDRKHEPVLVEIKADSDEEAFDRLTESADDYKLAKVCQPADVTDGDWEDR